MKRAVLWCIRLYQKTLSLDHGPLGRWTGMRSCRFYPSCSAFAHEAISKHGLGRGSVLTAKRILRCHPWHPGGFDPVP